MTDAKNVDNGGMGRRVSEVGDLLNDMTIIDPRATVDFVGKLATENGWTPERAGTVYAEYLRFLLMAWMSPTMVVPSRDVDQAWHLHLTCTRHYWDVLCGEILQKPLHHDPALGDETDTARHEDHYGRTLSLYAYLFDEEAPADVWPRGCCCNTDPAPSRTGDDVVLASNGWAMMAALALVGAGASFLVGFLLTGTFLVMLTMGFIVAAAASAADKEIGRGGQGGEELRPLHPASSPAVLVPEVRRGDVPEPEQVEVQDLVLIHFEVRDAGLERIRRGAGLHRDGGRLAHAWFVALPLALVAFDPFRALGCEHALLQQLFDHVDAFMRRGTFLRKLQLRFQLRWRWRLKNGTSSRRPKRAGPQGRPSSHAGRARKRW
jgi:hypothetical protein